MNNEIKLKSRDGTKNKLVMLYRKDGEPSKTFILKTSAPSLRIGHDGKLIDFIDPSGGPLIRRGAILPEAGDAVVSSIDYSEGFGYTITFK